MLPQVSDAATVSPLLSPPHDSTYSLLLGRCPLPHDTEFWYYRCAREGLCGKFTVFLSLQTIPLIASSPFPSLLPASYLLLGNSLSWITSQGGPLFSGAWRGGMLFYHLMGDRPLCELQGREDPGIPCSSRNSENYPIELASETDLNQQYTLKLCFLICYKENFYLQFYFLLQ